MRLPRPAPAFSTPSPAPRSPSSRSRHPSRAARPPSAPPTLAPNYRLFNPGPPTRSATRASLTTPAQTPTPTPNPKSSSSQHSNRVLHHHPPSPDTHPATHPDVVAATELYDVVVIGAGPAGLAISSALGAHGLRVVCADPHLAKPWPNHYGVWEDEFERVGLADCATARYEKTTVYAGQNKIVVDRPYIRVDREKLKARFVQRCQQAAVELLEARVCAVDHVSLRWSQVRLRPSGTTVGGEENRDHHREGDDLFVLRGRVVIDCTGHGLEFAERDGGNKPWAQAAYGIEAVVSRHPYATDEMLLMDFRDEHASRSPELRAMSEARPTFLYVFPCGERRGFFEETSVIAREAVPFEELERRLMRRLEHDGVKIERVVEEERSLIPMGGSLPRQGRLVGFGGAAGLVHPATGYMVGRTVRLAHQVAQAVAAGLEQAGPEGNVEAVTKSAWEVTWNVELMRQRDFLTFGAELLGTLGMDESRSFFAAFFKLPRRLWTRFLGYELDGAGERALFAAWFFAIADNPIRVRLLRAMVEIGRWRLIRSVLPVWLSAWQSD